MILWIGYYEPSQILRIGRDGTVETVAHDPTAHLLCHPTNLAFRDDGLMITANLGRWPSAQKQVYMEFFWFTVRLLAVTFGFAALHLYLWWRLVRDTTERGSRWRPAGAVALALLAAFGLGARFLVPSSMPLSAQELIGWPGWLWFGTFMYLVGLLIVAEPWRWWPRLKPVSVPPERLGREFDGYRITVVGDTHLSAIRGRGYSQRVVDQINRTQPDLIAFVGDLASGEAGQLRHATEPLAGLRARDGAYFVAGNAEHHAGADEWIARVEELGLTALPNTRVELPSFDLAGVNDLIVDERNIPGEVGPDLESALADRDPVRASILMAHQPNLIDRAVDWSVDLQLSGRTHGGQMWPVHILSRMRNIQLGGMQRYGDTQLYVTNGAGTNGPPMRVAANADITVMTLRSTQD